MNIKRYINGNEVSMENLKNYIIDDDIVLKTIKVVNQRINPTPKTGKISQLETK